MRARHHVAEFPPPRIHCPRHQGAFGNHQPGQHQVHHAGRRDRPWKLIIHVSTAPPTPRPPEPPPPRRQREHATYRAPLVSALSCGTHLEAIEREDQRWRQPEPRRHGQQCPAAQRGAQRQHRAQHGHDHERRHDALQLCQLVAERFIVVCNATESRTQTATVRKPLRRILLQAAHDCIREILRHRRGYFGQRLRCGRHMLHQQFAETAAIEGKLSAQHLVAHDANRVEIAASVDLGLRGRLLRRHVVRRTHHRSDLRQAGPRLQRVRPRDTEVGEHCATARIVDQDVVRLDVAVHDALPVRVIQCVGHLRQHRAGRLDIENRFPLDSRRQRLTPHEPHHEPAQPPALTERVQRHDADMLQAGDGLRLAAESLQHAGVRRGTGWQHLDCDQSLQGAIACEIHRPHATTPDQSDDFVLLTDRRYQRITKGIAKHLLGGFGNRGAGVHTFISRSVARAVHLHRGYGGQRVVQARCDAQVRSESPRIAPPCDSDAALHRARVLRHRSRGRHASTLTRP